MERLKLWIGWNKKIGDGYTALHTYLQPFQEDSKTTSKIKDDYTEIDIGIYLNGFVSYRDCLMLEVY
jgi:hypothetical protein